MYWKIFNGIENYKKKIDNIHDEKDSDIEPLDDLEPDKKYLYNPNPI